MQWHTLENATMAGSIASLIKRLTANTSKNQKADLLPKKLAQTATLDIERKLNKNIYIDEKQTLLEYYQNWARIHKKPNVSPVTWRKYQHTENKIEHYFKDAKIKNITNSMY